MRSVILRGGHMHDLQALHLLLEARIEFTELSRGIVLSMKSPGGVHQVLLPQSKEDAYGVGGLQQAGIIVNFYEDDPASAMSPEDIHENRQEILSALEDITSSYHFLLAGCGVYVQVSAKQDPREVAHLVGELLTTGGFPGVPVTVQVETEPVVTALAGTFADAPRGISAEDVQALTDLLEASTSVEDFLRLI